MRLLLRRRRRLRLQLQLRFLPCVLCISPGSSSYPKRFQAAQTLYAHAVALYFGGCMQPAQCCLAMPKLSPIGADCAGRQRHLSGSGCSRSALLRSFLCACAVWQRLCGCRVVRRLTLLSTVSHSCVGASEYGKQARINQRCRPAAANSSAVAVAANDGAQWSKSPKKMLEKLAGILILINIKMLPRDEAGAEWARFKIGNRSILWIYSIFI